MLYRNEHFQRDEPRFRDEKMATRREEARKEALVIIQSGGCLKKKIHLLSKY
jgi:hypothetical protein